MGLWDERRGEGGMFAKNEYQNEKNEGENSRAWNGRREIIVPLYIWFLAWIKN